MINNNNIYINIDQNLPPIIYKNIKETTIVLNYNSSINFSSIQLNLIDINTNEIIKSEKLFNNDIQNNQIIYNFELPLSSFQSGNKIGNINIENDNDNNYSWDEGNSWNILSNKNLIKALDKVLAEEKNWITINEKLNLYSINVDSLRNVIGELKNNEKIEDTEYNDINGMLTDLDATTLYFNGTGFKENKYYKIQLKGIYNEEEYYSNYGISRIINIKDYSYEIYYDDKQNIYFLEYKTFLKDNLLNFYKYQIVDETDQIIYDKDWILNETENNKIRIDSTTNSKEYVTEIFFKNINLNLSEQYKIIFYGKTNLNLEFKKEKYIQSYDLYPMLFPAKINLINNYENGDIEINFIPYFDFNESFENDYFSNNHHYELYRTNEFSDFKKWEYITDFKINQYSIKTFKFRDYQVIQGTKYKYGIRAVNINNIRTQMIESDYIIADFEDMFLIDSELNLKIKFNPKISSFKITKNENKIETLGQQYPYIIRNGMLGYKEMPISGLISFQMDIDNKIFNENNSELKGFFDTDLVGENIMKERKYKNYILNWLNNNKYKVLKTPTEGNFIVQLMNINLTPVDSLGRMLHSFQANAYEMDEYNYKNILKYDIYKNNLNINDILKIESLMINNLTETLAPFDFIEDHAQRNLINHNIYYYKFKDNNNNILCDIQFNNSLESLYLFGFKPKTKITILYNISSKESYSSTKEVYIGDTQELMIQNAKNILNIKFNFIENNVKTGITYSWIDTKAFNFNKYFKNNNFNKNNNIQIETIDFQDINIDKIKINKSDFNFTYNLNKSDFNGFFVIGNNIYDNKEKKHIQSYLYNKIDSENIIIAPKSIKIYPKTNIIQNLNNSLDFSFFVEYNNDKFYEKQKIKSNQLYRVPEFGSVEIDDLDMINSLWIGKNLIIDLSYILYDQILESE